MTTTLPCLSESRESTILGLPALRAPAPDRLVEALAANAEWARHADELIAEIAVLRARYKAQFLISDALRRGAAAAAASALRRVTSLCVELADAHAEISRLRLERAFDGAARAITGQPAAELAEDLRVPPADDDVFEGPIVVEDEPPTRKVVLTPGLFAALQRLPRCSPSRRVIDAQCVEVTA
ncbi:MAG TPA: hypothetical protein VFQ42_21985 [Mycobacterium sp.]|nr:hypothetical protein [Mycobacterium sp.]